MSFTDKIVIVTGASSGIGAAIAIKLSGVGAQVVLIGRNQRKLQNVSQQCAKNGKEPLTVVADMTKEDDVKKIVTETIQKFKKIDVLVNNAGVGHKLKSIEDPTILEEFDSVMATNLRSVVQLTNLAVPYLIKTKGNIINISSVAGMRTFQVTGFMYSTSKAALDSFGKKIALELAPKGVRVNNVNPGPVRTDFVSNMGYDAADTEKRYEYFADWTPLKRVSESGEVADLVAYLASDKAKSITGGTYVIDCGSFLK